MVVDSPSVDGLVCVVSEKGRLVIVNFECKNLGHAVIGKTRLADQKDGRTAETDRDERRAHVVFRSVLVAAQQRAQVIVVDDASLGLERVEAERQAQERAQLRPCSSSRSGSEWSTSAAC